MATLTFKAGFYGNDEETFYVTPAGHAWIVQSPDFDGIRSIQINEFAQRNARPVDALMTPDECLEYRRQIQDESGETLIEDAD